MDWKGWNEIGMAIWRATDGSAEGLVAFDVWSKKSPKYDAATTAKKWAAYFKAPPLHIGAGTIFYLADQAEPDWRLQYERDRVHTHVWHSAHFDFPCTPTGERHHDKAGRVYARVVTPPDGKESFVPEDELEPVAQTPPPQTPPPQTPPPQTPPPQPSTATQTATPKPSRFAVKTLEKINVSMAPNYLVKGILPRVGLGVVWGAPKTGKSFWTFDLAMHVACGRTYRGHNVRKGAVVYLALEGSYGFAGRVEAWRMRYLPPKDTPFYLIDEAVNLVADATALIAAIRSQLPQNPVLVVVDTLNRSLAGSENDDEDMGKYIKAADAIRTAFGCLVLLIHHCGVAGNRPRGHTSLSGADDVQIAVTKDKDGIVRSTVEFMKDGASGAAFASELQVAELGNDTDGDLITSCICIPSAAAAIESKLPKGAALALETLRKLFASAIDNIPAPADANLPPGTRVVRQAKWRDYFYKAAPQEKQASKQQAFVRAHKNLTEAKLIDFWDEYVWIAPNPDKT
jgi:hypothetical protein